MPVPPYSDEGGELLCEVLRSLGATTILHMREEMGFSDITTWRQVVILWVILHGCYAKPIEDFLHGKLAVPDLTLQARYQEWWDRVKRLPRKCELGGVNEQR